MQPVQQVIGLPRCFANSYGLCKYQVPNEGCVDVSGRRYACTSTEESSRLKASTSQVSVLGPLSVHVGGLKITDYIIIMYPRKICDQSFLFLRKPMIS